MVYEANEGLNSIRQYLLVQYSIRITTVHGVTAYVAGMSSITWCNMPETCK